MDVAGDDRIGVVKQGGHSVSENDLDLRTGGADDVGVKVNIVDAGEGVENVAELLAEVGEREHIAVGINAGSVQLFPVDKMVADLVGGIGEQQDDLAAALCHAAQEQREAVAAENGESHADGLAAGLGAHVGGNVVHRGIVALCAGDDGFGHGYNVTVVRGNARLAPCFLHGGGGDLSDIVALSDDRGADAAHNGTDGSHICSPSIYQFPKSKINACVFAALLL